MKDLHSDLVHTVRLALLEQPEDVRLYVARLVRKYRTSSPELAAHLETFLRNSSTRGHSPLRKAIAQSAQQTSMPADDESRLHLLKHFEDTPKREAPVLSTVLRASLDQLIQERRQARRLAQMGLQPTRSAIFVGPPGVGKTLTARWLAAQLELPLYVLDLTAVMSSLLGRSGNNLRAALDYAKQRQCVLLLDEIDSIAKRRSDDTDVGELKRLVTVILQEVDAWPTTGLLLAATNHPELIDPALWRRFDLKIDFPAPSHDEIKVAMARFMGTDQRMFQNWADVLAVMFQGKSFSDIERDIQRFRRVVALGASTLPKIIEDYSCAHADILPRDQRIEFAVLLSTKTRLSQHTISEITGVSRDTIRKHARTSKPNRTSAP